MRRWLVVLEEVDSGATEPDEVEAFLAEAVDWQVVGMKIVRVQRGGLLAKRVMEELPPVRHRDMGRTRA